MRAEELKQIHRELAVAIEQQQRINQQISEGKISLAQLTAAYLELQCLIPLLQRVLPELERCSQVHRD
ncbi:hypothetical protein [Nitrolancea hollandica]|uniref:Uncharacterized protein n=1 Tax=Nitrolancea hollandica Lb TaxID=1129897 RepID=I4EH05_9BACT|nr:hypothetical protein [Nitrolancea hollandica]CCF83967.1 hypothetical protein NITHO_2920009 [Nitrolancea hollandica Lb]